MIHRTQVLYTEGDGEGLPEGKTFANVARETEAWTRVDEGTRRTSVDLLEENCSLTFRKCSEHRGKDCPS